MTTEYDDDLEPETPRRPRRRGLTPVTGGLAAVVLLAGGFVAGVEVQKRQGGDGATARGGFPAAFAGRAGGTQGPGGSGAGGADATAASGTSGTVANVKGTTLYVTGSDGTTVKVKTTTNAKVTRTASGTVGSVHPGDSVVVQGTTAASGTVTATSITATAKGGAGGAGAAGGAALQVPQGFAPPAG